MGNLNNTTLHSDKFIVPNYLRSRSSSDQQRVKMSPTLQRLNSVGEDIDQDITGKYSSITSVRNRSNMSEIMLAFGDNSFKNSFGLRRDQSSHFSSKSIPISVTSNARELNMNRGKLVKSHSLPEVVSNQGLILYQSLMDFNFKLKEKPDRSWSIGSDDDVQTVYKQLKADQVLYLKSSHNFIRNRTLSESQMDPVFNIPINHQIPKVKDGIDYCVNNRSQENDEQLSLNSFCSSALSYLVQCKKSCATFSLCNVHKDHVVNKMSKDYGSKIMDQSSKRPSSTIFAASPKYIPNEQENHESEDSEVSTDFSSILYSPRKTCKKGRPSSKKQRKRRREKQKHASKASGSACSTSDIFNESSEKKDCSDGSNTSEFKSSSSVITPCKYVNTCLSQNVSTPIKSNSHHPIVKQFFSMVASSDSEDSGSDEGENCGWSQSEDSESACISSIFKQKHVPSLESLLSNECSDDSIAASPFKGSNLDLSGFSLSDEDVDDSIEFAASSPLSSFVPESLFPVPETKFQGETSGHIEDTDSIAEGIDGEHEVDMHEVNTKWNKMYSSPDICSCCTKNIAIGASRAVMKVSFPEEPELSTVYTVVGIENEDRAGMWHHYALDRERFERRIKEASQVLSPILEEKHRSAIVRRNANLLKLYSETQIRC